jgi:hypothetical protein
VNRIILIHFLLVICVLIFGIACQNSTTKEQTVAKVQKTVPDSMDYEIVEKTLEKEQRAQYYVVEGKAVVFFMLNKKEFNELLVEMGDSYRWDAEALFNNFTRQANTY